MSILTKATTRACGSSQFPIAVVCTTILTSGNVQQTKIKAVGQVDEALALYEEALDVGPKHAQVLYNTGVLQSEKGDVSFLFFKN